MGPGHGMADALRVLLVDDWADTRHLLRLVFERAGAQVVGEATDGAEAIERARELDPDLVVLDLQMPVMSGTEALPELRLAAPAARVVILSHLDRAWHEPTTAARGAVGYVEKRTSPEALVAEIILAAGILDAAGDAVASASSRLPLDHRSAGAARQVVERALQDWTHADLLDTVRLLVSEVVTNALVHAGTALDLSVRLERDRLRIEVTDLAAGTPAVQTASAEMTSGRGLALVDMLADRWGTEPREPGKTVWFEIDRPDAQRRR